MNDLSQKRLLADQAQDLLDDKGLFMMAVRTVKVRWNAELMKCRSRPAQDEIVARLQAMDSIPELLQTVINDYKFAASGQLRKQPHG